MPILVMKDLAGSRTSTGMVFARVVQAKGAQAYAVKRTAMDIGLLGHRELVLKSDGEPAMVALKNAVKDERSERIVLEESPVGESKSNGAIENAIQQVQGQVRTLKDSLEARLGARLAEDSTLIPWLVTHAARTINRYHVGQDGLTAYRRWKGKAFRRSGRVWRISPLPAPGVEREGQTRRPLGTRGVARDPGRNR